MPGEKCILCYSGNLVEAEAISVEQLIQLYKRRAHVDVGRLFKGKEIFLYTCSHCGLKMFLPQVIGDGKFYDDLQKYKGYYLSEKPEFIEAAKFIHPGDNVLEVGAGEGIFSNYIKCKTYTGLEFSEDAIAKAKARGITLLSQALAEHAAENKEKYDIVCYFQVLEHVSHPGEFIKASVDALKPGGKLILAVPSADSFIRDAVNFYLNMPPHHASVWTDHTLTMIAELNQIGIVHVFHEPLHPMHRLFYYKTAMYKKLIRKCHVKERMLDNSAASWWVYGLASGAARFKNLFSSAKNLPMGQSVTFVYQKPL